MPWSGGRITVTVTTTANWDRQLERIKRYANYVISFFDQNVKLLFCPALPIPASGGQLCGKQTVSRTDVGQQTARPTHVRTCHYGFDLLFVVLRYQFIYYFYRAKSSLLGCGPRPMEKITWFNTWLNYPSPQLAKGSDGKQHRLPFLTNWWYPAQQSGSIDEKIYLFFRSVLPHHNHKWPDPIKPSERICFQTGQDNKRSPVRT